MRDRNPDVPDWLVEIIDKLHAKRPRDRFQSANEVERLLTRHLRPPPFAGQIRSAGTGGPAPNGWIAVAVGGGARRAGCGHRDTTDLGCVSLVVPQTRGRLLRRSRWARGRRRKSTCSFRRRWPISTAKNTGRASRRSSALSTMKPNDRRGEVVGKLIALTEDESPFIRWPAIKALGTWGGKDEVPFFIQLTLHKDPSTRREALKVIGRFKDPRTLEPIIQCFRDGSTRKEAGDALREFGVKAEPNVRALLDEDNVFLKRDAILLLKDIGTEASVPAIQAAAAKAGVHRIHLDRPYRKRWPPLLNASSCSASTIRFAIDFQAGSVTVSSNSQNLFPPSPIGRPSSEHSLMSRQFHPLASHKAPKNNRRLRVEGLEDRTVPSFTVAPQFSVGPGTGISSKPVSVTSADFNGDGFLDVATANLDAN